MPVRMLRFFLGAVLWLGPAGLWAGGGGLMVVFDEQLAQGLVFQPDPPRDGLIAAEGGYESERWLFMRRSDPPLTIQGLRVPVREDPGPGEARFVSWAWRKWGAGQAGLRFERDPAEDGENARGKAYDFTFFAGEGEPEGSAGLLVTDSLGGVWQLVTKDLWAAFGDFIVTGLTMTMSSRDGGFDALCFTRKMEDFAKPVALAQTPLLEKAPAAGEPRPPLAGEAPAVEVAEETTAQAVEIDWAAQIRAGGWMMYPLYLCGFGALVIGIQRLLTVRADRLAPEGLRAALAGDVRSGEGAERVLEAYRANPSTLGRALAFVMEHRHAGLEAVSRAAGDIASRDIREHLARIYPLSVIAAIAPLLGLLGTIIGMIEAFGLVAIYGDEGGAAILSDSISKALITTAAGLVIAAPSIALHHFLKNRILSLASVIEVELENVTTELYLKPSAAAPEKPVRDDAH